MLLDRCHLLRATSAVAVLAHYCEYVLTGRISQGFAAPDAYQAKALIPVMSRPTMRVWMVSVPSKVWTASMSAM
jgi:hypothetical protein